MWVKSLSECVEFIANDGCHLREILHPRNDAVQLPFSLAIARVELGKRSHPHFLRQTELYYIIQGRGRMHVGAETRECGPGDLIVVPPEIVQWVENTGEEELLFANIVSPPWQAEDDVRLP